MTNTNPFEALEQAAKTSKNRDIAARAIAQARSRILLACDAKSAFFGMLAMRLRPVEDTKTETATTDGRELRYNPDWVAGLNERQMVGFIAHEVLHCAMAHQSRRGTRDMTRWNLAGDLACNGILAECQYELPGDAPRPGVGQYKDLAPGQSAEAYYAQLQSDGKDGGQSPSGMSGQSSDDGDSGEPDSPSQDPGGSGGVKDAGDDADRRESESDWKGATAQAAAESERMDRGELPAGLARAVKSIVHETADWREILRRFVTRDAKNEYTWSPPNRRLIHLGLYMPSIASDSLGRVIVAVDTSGSIGRDQLAKFCAELQSMLDAYEVQLQIVYHDAEIAGVQEWTPDDGPLELDAKGGGGTSHVCVFDHVGADDPPTCLVCLTDGYTVFPREAPDYPVLWAMTTDIVAPFGESVRLVN